MHPSGSEVDQLIQQVTLDSMSDIDILIRSHYRESHRTAELQEPVTRLALMRNMLQKAWDTISCALICIFCCGKCEEVCEEVNVQIN